MDALLRGAVVRLCLCTQFFTAGELGESRDPFESLFATDLADRQRQLFPRRLRQSNRLHSLQLLVQARDSA